MDITRSSHDTRKHYDATRALQGRLVTEGVAYVGSWVSADLTCCFQVMEAADRSALNEWLARWADLVDFDVVPVITSAEAQGAIAPRL